MMLTFPKVFLISSVLSSGDKEGKPLIPIRYPSNPASDPLIEMAGALAYALASLRFLSMTIILAQIYCWKQVID